MFKLTQGRHRRYGHGRTNNTTDNVWPKLTRSPAVAEMVGQKLAVTYISIKLDFYELWLLYSTKLASTIRLK